MFILLTVLHSRLWRLTFSSAAAFPQEPLLLAHLNPYWEVLGFLERIQGPLSSSCLPLPAFATFSFPFFCDPSHPHLLTLASRTTVYQGPHNNYTWLGLREGISTKGKKKTGHPSSKDETKYLHFKCPNSRCLDLSRNHQNKTSLPGANNYTVWALGDQFSTNQGLQKSKYEYGQEPQTG